ncbi:MAG: ABC transporter ATP-binding protein [Clostridia bacterium]|nr:ABC transporter ATP-binding protein [Clostridia bacterium]
MLKVENLAFGYTKKTPILKGASISLEKGEIGVVLGPNGAGKSTLFKNILGLLKPSSGVIEIDGKDMINIAPRERAKSIAYVPQSVDMPMLSVYETILAARLPYYTFAPTKKDREIVFNIIREFGLEHYMNTMATNLSGGEKQIVAIARAMAQEPKVLIFDEPTSNLDISRELLLQDRVSQIAKNKDVTILMAVHDLNLAYDIGDKFFFVKDGEVVAQGGKEVFTEVTIKETFNRECHIKEIDNQIYIKYVR